MTYKENSNLKINWLIDKVLLVICGFFLVRTVNSLDKVTELSHSMDKRLTAIETKLNLPTATNERTYLYR